MATDSPNKTQTEFWNGVGGRRWAEQQSILDRAMKPFGEAALAKASVRPGETVLDVGSGCGDTLLSLAAAVGREGSVCGIDVSAPMVAVARARTSALSQVRIIEADAAQHGFDQRFDLIFSRFGLMFFEDAHTAFHNLRSATKDEGRMVFVCWRTVNDNPWYYVPLDVIRSVWPDAPPLAVDDGPGPFAFTSADKVRGILENAAFRDVHIDRYDSDVVIGTDRLDDAVRFALSAGPAARLLNDATPKVHERVRVKMAEALEPLHANNRYALVGSTWVVTAR